MKISEHQVTVVLSWSLFIMTLITFLFRLDVNSFSQSVITLSAACILLLNLGAYHRWQWAYTRHVAVSVITVGCALYFDERYFQAAFPAGMLFAPAMSLLLLKNPQFVLYIGTGQFLVVLGRIGFQPGITIVSVTMYYAILIILIIARIISDNAREDVLLNEIAARESSEKIEEKNQELEGINRSLYDEVEQRKLLEEQLVQAQKMESVGRLAGGVAHDFNNMLSIIIGYAESALEVIDEKEPVYQDLTEILEAGKRSADITRQLLAFARQQTSSPQVLQLNDNIESMLKMLRRLMGEDIDLIWHPSVDLWPVKLDPSQLDQILANLCVNARDAILGTGTVTIETKNVVIDNDYCKGHTDFVPGEFVLFALSDSGKGISPDLIGKVFEPFFTTKGLNRGTGLGLSTVYGIVKQNNGFIYVYSELGNGTTVKIYLPRYMGQIKDLPAEKIKELAISQGETILIVEDDLSILRLCGNILISLGYTVLTAHSPSDAILISREHIGKIDLLLTDVIMPGMNGRDLSKELTKHRLDLKTLFMSGYTANVIAQSGVLENGLHFISKPLSKKEVAEKVRHVLDCTF